jgi:hypothetical protein
MAPIAESEWMVHITKRPLIDAFSASDAVSPSRISPKKIIDGDHLAAWRHAFANPP